MLYRTVPARSHYSRAQPESQSRIRQHCCLTWHAGCGLPSGNGVGLADRAIRQCSPVCLPRPGAGASILAPLIQDLDVHCVGSLSRIFRLGSALHSSRLHRPGVERDGGAASTERDHEIIKGQRLKVVTNWRLCYTVLPRNPLLGDCCVRISFRGDDRG